MRKYFICLLDSDSDGVSYQRGDIVTRKPKTGPPGIPWASFESPPGLAGKPKLASIDDPGTGTLTFHYTVGVQGQGQKGFCVKCCVGLPLGHAETEEPWSAKDGPPPVKETEKPPELKHGAGLAATAGRSFTGWTGKSKPAEPQPPPEEDLLDPPDDGIDWLRR